MGSVGKLFKVAESMCYNYFCVCKITDILWGSQLPQKFGQVSIKWFHTMTELFSIGDIPHQILPFWNFLELPHLKQKSTEHFSSNGWERH